MTREELEYWKAKAPSSYEKQELGALWKDAGLPWLGWQNGIPMFDPDTDWEAVRQVADAFGGASNPPASSELEPPQFVVSKPKTKRPMTKKRGA